MRGNDQQQFRAADAVGIEIRSSGPATDRLPWRQLILTFSTLLLFSWLGIALSRQSEGVATIWLTNGMLFAIVITRPRRVWLHFFAVGLLRGYACGCFVRRPGGVGAGRLGGELD